MIGTPTLALQPYSIVHQKDSTTCAFPCITGFAMSVTRTDGADTGNGFEQLG